MSDTRRFSRSQRLALYQAADGKCQICGKPLDASFHADHVQPYSLEGETDVLNGQALCSDCNLKKGVKMPIQYRTWQEEMFTLFQQHMEKWFMCSVVTGGGKSMGMARCAKFSLDTGESNFLIVIVPTNYLKKQWRKMLWDVFGLRMFTKYEGYVTTDFDGVIVTYHQVAMSPQMIRTLHNGRKVFVIFDEPHHMADGRSWGNNAHDALQPCVRGILGTGTPFRSDDYPIPFVNYDIKTNELVTHYEYNYDDGLIDQVVRALFFRKIGAEATWYSYTEELVTATFETELDERQVKERLNAVIEADGDFVHDVFKQAYAEIMHMRRTEQPNAKILVIGVSIEHLTALASVWRTVTNGNEPLIVSSTTDETLGHGDKEDIATFKDDDRVAIFAIDMVSEGVDIPPLRSLVYLTNKTAPLYFYQAIGRVVRVEPGKELLNGYIYLPSDPRLLELANTIKQRRIAVLTDVPRVCPRCGENPCVCAKRVCQVCGQSPCVCPRQKKMLDVINAVPIYEGGIYDDESYTETEWKAAELWKREGGYRIPTEEALKIRRRQGIAAAVLEAPVAIAAPEPEELRTTLSNRAAALANKVAKARIRRSRQEYSQELFRRTIALVHWEWETAHNGKKHKQETIEGFERKIDWLTQELGKGS